MASLGYDRIEPLAEIGNKLMMINFMSRAIGKETEAFKKQRTSWLDGFKTFIYSASSTVAGSNPNGDSFVRTTPSLNR